MERRTVYCTACDKEVELALSPAALHRGQASLPDGQELVCLDFGSRCTGERCPMFGYPTVVMGVRLARSGLAPEQLEHVRAPCDGCGNVQELEVVDADRAHCPACGTINTWRLIRLDGGEYVAVTGRRAEETL